MFKLRSEPKFDVKKDLPSYGRTDPPISKGLARAEGGKPGQCRSGSDSQDPVEIETYSFTTTAANIWTESIRHERLPVLLVTTEDQDIWLNDNPKDWERLLKPFPPDRMGEIQAGLDKVDSMKG